MCTFNHETAATVSGLAVGPVRWDLEDAFPGSVSMSQLEGAGTLVEAIAWARPVPGTDPASAR